MSEKEYIHFHNVSVGYAQKNPVLAGLSFSIDPGDFIGLIGPNGSGKTTLLKTLLGLLKPVSGKVKLNRRAIRFGYVKQRRYVDDLFPLTVGQVVCMGRYGLIGPFRKPSKNDWERVRLVLDKVGIPDLIEKNYRDLSGGQKQRVLIARALVSEPNVLLLDEPTNDLDVAGEHQTMELLKKLNETEGITLIVVSHLLNVVLGYARQIGLTGLPRFIFEPIETIATSKRLSELYNHPLQVKEIDGKKVILHCDSFNRNI